MPLCCRHCACVAPPVVFLCAASVERLVRALTLPPRGFGCLSGCRYSITVCSGRVAGYVMAAHYSTSWEPAILLTIGLIAVGTFVFWQRVLPQLARSSAE